MSKEEKIAIQKESSSKEKSFQGKISLPKHTYLLTSQYDGSHDSLNNQSGCGVGLCLSPLNPSKLLKEKLEVSISYQESHLVYDRRKI